MGLYSETNIRDFNAWSGAIGTQDRIIAEGKANAFDNMMDELYPDGMTDTEYNDILWFESDWIFETLGIRSESMIEDELNDKKQERQDLLDEYEADTEDMTDEEKAAYYAENYDTAISDLDEEIKELREELDEALSYYRS